MSTTGTSSEAATLSPKAGTRVDMSGSTPTPEDRRTDDIATLADLLHETAEHHDPYEKSAPKHDWWDWYATYLNAREHGSPPEEASKAAALYMEQVRHIVVSR